MVVGAISVAGQNALRNVVAEYNLGLGLVPTQHQNMAENTVWELLYR